MSTTEDSSAGTSGMPGTRSVDMKLEVLIIPVSDADRAKEFYADAAYMVAEQAGTELPR